MAIALTAWLIAPAPMACTSTRPLLRITPAMAPATATGLEVAETFSTSTGTRSVIAGTPSRMFSVDSLDRCGPTGGTSNGNQYRIECHGSGGDHEPVRHPCEKALEHDILVHADTPVPGADHANVGHVSRPTGKDPRVRGRDVGVRPDHCAGSAVQVPAHRGLLGGCLRVHVAEGDLDVGVGGQDVVRCAKRVVERVGREDSSHQVHDQHLVVACGGLAPALPRRPWRIVGRPEHSLLGGEVGDEVLLGENVVAGRDDVRPRRFELRRNLAGEPESSGGVLAVEDGEVRFQLLLEPGQERLHGLTAGLADHVGDEENANIVRAHKGRLSDKKKGSPSWAPLGCHWKGCSHAPARKAALRIGPIDRSPERGAGGLIYLAYSMARVSRTTVTRICPGKLSSVSIRLAMSLAINWAAASSICSGLTRIRTSRPAWMAYDC